MKSETCVFEDSSPSKKRRTAIESSKTGTKDEEHDFRKSKCQK